MKNSPWKTTLRYTALLSVAGLLLAACGDSDSQDTPVDDPSTDETEETPEADGEPADGPVEHDEEPLNVGQISNSVAFFPLYVAEEEGYFEDNNVTLGERPRTGTGARLAAALTSGSVDLGAGVFTDALNLSGVEDGAVITTALVSEYYVDVIVSTTFDGADVSAPINEKVQSLQGKNIGITGPGSGTEALLIYLFEQEGLDANRDAELVNLGSDVPAALGALETGQVDALAFFQPVGQNAEAQGIGEIYISPQRGDVPGLEGAIHGVVFATEDLIAQKPVQFAGFNAAIQSALELIASDPERTEELLRGYLEGSSEDVIQSLLEILPQEMSETITVSQESFETASNFHITSGLADEVPEYSSFVHPDIQE